jgi:hypothetical protein
LSCQVSYIDRRTGRPLRVDQHPDYFAIGFNTNIELIRSAEIRPSSFYGIERPLLHLINGLEGYQSREHLERARERFSQSADSVDRAMAKFVELLLSWAIRYPGGKWLIDGLAVPRKMEKAGARHERPLILRKHQQIRSWHSPTIRKKSQ